MERTMGKMKPVVSLFAVIGAVLAIYFGLRLFGVLSQGYSWSEMDWNQDGITSIGEFFAASDIGKREITKNGKKCTEYFSYKDGLAVKVVCPG
jgi:hypothetical protein